MKRFASILIFLAAPAWADRIPVAVLWNGADAGDGDRVAEMLDAALRKSPTVRPIDSQEHRQALIQGGFMRQVQALLARADAAFVKFKCAEAVNDYEAAEKLLLNDVAFARALPYLAPVERNLLSCYDNLGRTADTVRAAERLSWTAGSNEDLAALLAKNYRSRVYEPARAPVEITSDPPGAQVWRNLQAVGPTPLNVAGGDPNLDVIDVEVAGHRRVHVPLGAEALKVTLGKETRLGALLDEVRLVPQESAVTAMKGIGKQVGATRLVVLTPDGVNRLQARWFDVSSAKWAEKSLRVDSAPGAMEKVTTYVTPAESATAQAEIAKMKQQPTKTKSRWGKWYTWVAAGAVAALVVGLLVAQNVGDDKLTVTVSK